MISDDTVQENKVIATNNDTDDDDDSIAFKGGEINIDDI